MKREKYPTRKIRLVGNIQLETAISVLRNAPLDASKIRDIKMKICTKCKELKTISNFSKNKNNKDGLKFQCKLCDKIEIAAHRKKFPEKAIAYRASYYLKNSDYIKNKMKERYAKSPEKFKAVSRKKYLENPNYAKNYSNQYRIKNIEKVTNDLHIWRLNNKKHIQEYSKKYALNNHDILRNNWRLRRARKKGAEGTHTANDIKNLQILQKNKCICCKKSIKNKFHVDHIMPLALGGSNSKENIQLLCPHCNVKKHAKHPVDFMQSRGYLL